MRPLIPQLLLGTLFAAVSLLVAGCGFTQGKKDAEMVLTRHFQAITTNGFEVALADYGPAFFEKTTKDEWSKALAGMSRKLGTYQNHTVTTWRMFTKAGPIGSGTTVLLECKVTYSKHTATESYRLFKGIADSDYKIIGHHINSMALMTE